MLHKVIIINISVAILVQAFEFWLKFCLCLTMSASEEEGVPIIPGAAVLPDPVEDPFLKSCILGRKSESTLREFWKVALQQESSIDIIVMLI